MSRSLLPSVAGPCALALLTSLLGGLPALAQPAPEVAPAPALATPPPDPAAMPSDPYWSPIGDDGWPLGHSMETLRGLRECGTGELQVEAGAAITCRPPALVGPTHLAFSVDWTTGIALDDRTSGGAQALGVELGYALTRHLQLAGRYEVMGLGDTTRSDLRVSQHAMGLAKWRLFTDEVDRDAWTLGIGGGWAFRDMMLGGAAPIVRASLAREIGLYLDDANAMTTAFELAYERALDDRGAGALLGSVKFGFELNIHEPANLGTLDDAGPQRHRTQVDLLFGSGIGLGMSVALHPATALPRLSLVSSASYLFGNTDAKQQSFEGASWAVQSGPQVTLFSRWVTPYAGVSAGAAWYSQATGAERYWIVTPELGVRFQGCQGKIDVGAWLRTDAENDFDVLAAGAVLRGGFGGCGGRGGTSPAFATRPQPPAPIPSEVVVREPALAPPSIDVQGGVGAGVGIDVGGQVAVEVKPIVIEVQLGAALFGGAVSVRIDPRLVPIDRMRGAGFVQIELTGPRAVLAQYRAELGGTIGRGGARVDAWAVVPTGDTVVRAKLTIWPAGSRPPLQP